MELQHLLLSLLIFTISLFHLCPNPAAAFPCPTPQPNSEDFIRKCCNVTSHPDICYTSLSPYAREVQNDPSKLAQVAVSFCLSKVQGVKDYTSNLPIKKFEPSLGAALEQCVEMFEDAVSEIGDTLEEMKKKEKPNISDLQTWLSSASTDEDTCLDGFEDVKDNPVKTDVINRTWEIGRFTSIALSLVVNYAGK